MLQAGDLILVRGHLSDIGNDAVKLGEWLQHPDKPIWGMYAHVAISLGDGKIAEANTETGTGYGILDGYAGNYDIGRIDLTDEQREAITKEAVAQFGKPYDWFLIGDIAWDAITKVEIPYHERCRRICSTYVRSVILNATGIALANPNCTPEDIALDPHVTIERVI